MPVIAGLGPVMIGLVALAIVFGLYLIVKLIDAASKPIGYVPIFTDIIQALARGLAYAGQGLAIAFTQFAQTCVDLFLAIPRTLQIIVDAIEASIYRHLNYIRMIITQAIPALYRTISSAVQSAIDFCVSTAARYFAVAMAALASTRDWLYNLLRASVAQVTAYAQSLFNIAMAAMTRAIASVTQYALNLFNLAMARLGASVAALGSLIALTRQQLIAYSNAMAQWAMNTAYGASIDFAKRYSDQLINLYDQAIARAAGVALARPWGIALPAIDSIAIAVPESVAGVLARTGAIPRAIPRDLAGSLGAVAAVGAIAIDWVAKCGVSLCRNSRPFGDQLAALEDAALIALLFDLVTSAVEDPNGTAKDIHGEMSNPLFAIGREFADMVGLAG